MSVNRREKVEERYLFSYDEKKQLLKKTGNKCAHCGRALNYKNCTVDHAIPIDKGGGNAGVNLVPLCQDCNSDKNNVIMDPEVYFKYLNDDDKHILSTFYEIYCDNITWLYAKNFTREERMLMHYFYIRSLDVVSSRKKGISRVYADAMPQTAVLMKAGYSDLDEIYEYVVKYQKKMGMDYDHIKDRISEFFSEGCIYAIKRADEILCVLPVKLRKFEYPDVSCYSIYFAGLPCIYQKPDYIPLVVQAVRIIGEGAALSNKKKVTTFHIAEPSCDEFVARIISRLSRYGKAWYADDSKEVWHDVGIINYYNVEPDELEWSSINTTEVLDYTGKQFVKAFGISESKNEGMSDYEFFKMKAKKKGVSKSRAKELKRVKRAHANECDESYYVNK